MDKIKRVLGFIIVELGFTAVFVGIVIAMATAR